MRSSRGTTAPGPDLAARGVPVVALAALLLLAGCASSSEPGGEPTAGVPTDLPSTSLPSTSLPPSSSAPSSSSSPSFKPGTADPSVPPAENAAQLTIVYSADGTTKQTWTLTCAPNGGTHPDPGAACAALSTATAAAFAATPLDLQCTQVYGGPQTASVSGTWRGESVSATFSRTNGCQISRWTKLEGLLPTAG